jgi:hypothetical protein
MEARGLRQTKPGALMGWRPEDRQNKGYNTAEYRRKRDACLKGARWRCQIRVPGVCIGSASQADHEFGIANDPHHDHLRAACDPCHKHVTARQGSKSNRTLRDPPCTPRTAW